jgi:hypothetical protein
MKTHWAVQGLYIKETKYQKSHNVGFPVKLCPTCNRAWEKHYKEIQYNLDFPKRGLRKKECKFCKINTLQENH